jgi:hypothetical protein
LLHDAAGGRRRERQSLDVEAESAVPRLGFHLEEGFARPVARIVDEHVQAAE